MCSVFKFYLNATNGKYVCLWGAFHCKILYTVHLNFTCKTTKSHRCVGEL